jgi:uncharacterized delta-60 repeat protein
LVRYNANGTIDNTFGSHGGVITTFAGDAYSAAASLAMQTNGDVVAAGTAQLNNPAFGLSQGSFALVRYLANGRLDTTFGTGGRVTTAFSTQEAAIVAIAIQSDGKIVALGNEVPPTFGRPITGSPWCGICHSDKNAWGRGLLGQRLRNSQPAIG